MRGLIKSKQIYTGFLYNCRHDSYIKNTVHVLQLTKDGNGMEESIITAQVTKLNLEGIELTVTFKDFDDETDIKKIITDLRL